MASPKHLGLYGKFTVQRVDGKDQNEGDKHYGCNYFVLDTNHDPHAVPALRAYADSCEKAGYDLLAADLRAMANRLEASLM